MKKILVFLGILFFCFSLFSANIVTDEQNLDMYHLMTNLLFQLSIIIFLARIFGYLFEKLGLPGVLGELSSGVIIGPFLLGSVPVFGFPDGIFPEHIGSNLPISPELYGFSTFGLIILLFLAGLETDLKLLYRYSLAGLCIGISGIVFSFLLGAYVGSYIFIIPFLHPVSLFFGLISSVTSVGITARILSERRSMDSPEGVTIHLTTVINDVIVIIMLTVIIAISSTLMDGKNPYICYQDIIFITLKSISILSATLILGLVFSKHISNFFKLFKNKFLITFLAFGFALLISGFFEKAGLAMIIGAYITGLILSKTDISFLIQETLHPIERLFVPIFFAVMGMKLNIITLITEEYIFYGFAFALLAILVKVISCGLPSMFFNFNKLGALRIGFGMAPRGEVALIISGIGLSVGILNENSFGVLILMIILTTLISPQILNSFLKIKEKGVKKDYDYKGTILIEYKLPDDEEIDFLVSYITKFFHNEGFYINKRILDDVIYEIRKDEVFIKLFVSKQKITFKASEEDAGFVKAVVYESFLKLDNTVSKLKAITKPVDMRKDLVFNKSQKYNIDLSKIIDPNCVILNMKAKNKEESIKELVCILHKNNKIFDKKIVLEEILNREKSMSTGMQHGLAIPHTRTNQANTTSIAIGFCRNGLDFDSLDGQLTKTIACLVSSNKENDPHIQVLAAFSSFLNSKEALVKILNCSTEQEVWSFFLTEDQKNVIYYDFVYNSVNSNNFLR